MKFRVAVNKADVNTPVHMCQLQSILEPVIQSLKQRKGQTAICEHVNVFFEKNCKIKSTFFSLIRNKSMSVLLIFESDHHWCHHQHCLDKKISAGVDIMPTNVLEEKQLIVESYFQLIKCWCFGFVFQPSHWDHGKPWRSIFDGLEKRLNSQLSSSRIVYLILKVM